MKSLIQVLLLIISFLFLAGCDVEDGSSNNSCILASQFGSSHFTLKAGSESSDDTGYIHDYNTAGIYNPEIIDPASWKDTGLIYNGGQVVIKITGSIIPWDINQANLKSKDVPYCRFCAKDTNLQNGCYCYKNDEFNPIDVDGNKQCTGGQESKIFTYPDSFNYYHRALNRINNQENRLIPDEQYICKYRAGMSAYLGFFGPSGNDIPSFAFHLFSDEGQCDIDKTVIDGKELCIDEYGADVTSYIYRSEPENSMPKTIDSGKNITERHQSGEIMKIAFSDSWYSDNQGSYNMEFVSGINQKKISGLLEYIVATVEELVLGKEVVQGNNNGYNVTFESGAQPSGNSSSIDLNNSVTNVNFIDNGGLLKILYNNLVIDSDFINAIRLLLLMYVVIFGISVLLGTIEINRKEIIMRVIKISVIIMFVSPTSWNIYNNYIVKFFHEGTNELVSKMALFSNEGRSGSGIEQCNQAINSNYNNSTRFTCIDNTIKKLFSQSVTNKIWGLFFGKSYGFIVIIAVYALIFFFIYVMLFAATVYLINLLKIIFALSLGPIFMCFILFNQTYSIFTNWIKFLVSRSLELVVLFSSVYIFWYLIEKGFYNLLYYEVCYVERYFIKPFIKFKVVEVNNLDRSFPEWMKDIFEIGGLIFITFMIISAMGQVASSLSAFGGAEKGGGSKNDQGQISGASSFALANNMMKGLYGLVGSGISTLQSSANTARAISFTTKLMRKSGIAGLWNRAGKMIPFRGPRSRLRDRIIDNAISEAKKKSRANGLSGIEAGKFIRNDVLQNLEQQRYGGMKGNKDGRANTFAMLGIDNVNIEKRLDKILIEEPIKNRIKQEALNVKHKIKNGNILSGKEAREEVKRNIANWVKNNIAGADDAMIANYLRGNKNQIKEQVVLSRGEAAKAFVGDKELQSKYMQHLQQEQFEQSQKYKDAKRKGFIFGAKTRIKKFGRHLMRNPAHNPKLAQENFARRINRLTSKLEKEESFNKRFKVREIKKEATLQYLKNVKPKSEIDKLQEAKKAAYLIHKNLDKKLKIDSDSLESKKLEKDALLDQNKKLLDLFDKDRTDQELQGALGRIIEHHAPVSYLDKIFNTNAKIFDAREKFITKEEDKSLMQKAIEFDIGLRKKRAIENGHYKSNIELTGARIAEKICYVIAKEQDDLINSITESKLRSTEEKIAKLENVKKEFAKDLFEKEFAEEDLERLIEKAFEVKNSELLEIDYDRILSDPQYSTKKAFELYFESQNDIDKKIEDVKNAQQSKFKKSSLDPILEGDEDEDD